MKKKLFITLGIILGILVLGLCIYPMVEFYKGDTLYVLTYKEDWSEWEENMCYGESYSYNEERNISIHGWEFKNFLFFKWFELEYKEGNVCDTEYYLEEEYIDRIIKEAEIIYNDENIDLAELIKGRKAIEGNKRYLGNEYNLGMTFKLDDRTDELFIFYLDDLLIIQVGSTDEGPKYIAYELIEQTK